MKYPIGLKFIARLFYKLLSRVSNIEIDVLRPDVQPGRELPVGCLSPSPETQRADNHSVPLPARERRRAVIRTHGPLLTQSH
jgi:hypothetical protein